MNRREFISLLGGAALTWPLAARAQQPDQIRRVGVFMHMSENDAEGQTRLAAFRQGLQQFGWIDGRNVRLDVRWGAGDAERIRRFSAELVALRLDVIFASASNTVAALQRAARMVPIVVELTVTCITELRQFGWRALSRKSCTSRKSCIRFLSTMTKCVPSPISTSRL